MEKVYELNINSFMSVGLKKWRLKKEGTLKKSLVNWI